MFCTNLAFRDDLRTKAKREKQQSTTEDVQNAFHFSQQLTNDAYAPAMNGKPKTI